MDVDDLWRRKWELFEIRRNRFDVPERQNPLSCIEGETRLWPILIATARWPQKRTKLVSVAIPWKLAVDVTKLRVMPHAVKSGRLPRSCTSASTPEEPSSKGTFPMAEGMTYRSVE